MGQTPRSDKTVQVQISLSRSLKYRQPTHIVTCHSNIALFIGSIAYCLFVRLVAYTQQYLILMYNL